MANPTAYTISYSFSDWQADNPAIPLPAASVDNEYANIAIALASLRTAVMDVRRSDGELVNGIVTRDSLAADLKIALVDASDLLNPEIDTEGTVNVFGRNAEGVLTLAAASGLVGGGSAVLPPVVTVATTTLTPALIQAGSYFRCTHASGCAVTIPPQTSVAWEADTELHFRQSSATAIVFTGGAGVTINIPAGYEAETLLNGAVVTLKRAAADSWDIFGLLAAA